MNEVKDIRSPSSLTVYKQRFICSDMQAKSMSLFLFLRNSPTQARAALFVRFLAHTLWYTTVGRTPLDEWSARRRDYLTAHNTHKRQTPMPPGWIFFCSYFFFLSFCPFILCVLLYILLSHVTYSLYNTQHKHPWPRRIFVLFYLLCPDSPAFYLLSLLYNTHNTNIHAPGGIWTRKPSKRAAADLRLRPHGHRNPQDSNPQSQQASGCKPST